MADVEQIEPVDAVVGLLPWVTEQSGMQKAIDRIVSSSLPLKLAVVHPPYTPNGASPMPDVRRRLIADPLLAPNSSLQSNADSHRAIFDTALKLGARGCAIIASDPSGATSDWTRLLLQPIVDQHFDLVTPCYSGHKYEAMINRAIVYPLVRALYGKRIRYPLGPDFGVSNALLGRMNEAPKSRLHALPCLLAEAVSNGMAICQAQLGARVYAAQDLTNLSSLLAQVLGPLFLDVERYAAHWQKARGSQAIPDFGEVAEAPPPETPPDVSRLIESFQLGARNLQEIWGIILPPSTLVELRRMLRTGAAAFRMPDLTWAHVVYDFALAHRLRTISRDQMLRALTPIYLGWVASYALEIEHASPAEVEARVEKLCVVYEDAKSYFVSRWRWPDRFNP